MKTTNLFELATRKKFRFQSTKGNLRTEDLWDLSLKELDAIYKTLNAEVKRASEESLLSTKSDADIILDAKIEIIKHIVAVKQAEAVMAANAAANKQMEDKIRNILAEKEDADLRSKTPEELMEMLANLGK